MKRENVLMQHHISEHKNDFGSNIIQLGSLDTRVLTNDYKGPYSMMEFKVMRCKSLCKTRASKYFKIIIVYWTFV